MMFVVVACTHNPHPLGKPLPNLTYDNLTPYNIQGGSVIIKQSFQPTPKMQEIANKFPVAPDILIKRYASKRFVTTGVPAKLIFDIQNAALRKISDEDNLVGFLSGASEDAYELNIMVAMTPIRQDGQQAKPFTIKVTRHIYMQQNSSLAEREFRQFEMLEKAIKKMDETVTDMVQNKMTAEYF